MKTNFWDFAIVVVIVGGVLCTIGCANEIRKEVVEERLH